MELHEGVQCDGCMGAIAGVRYKCTSCVDYDLCSGCKARGFHADHQFMEIKSPAAGGGGHLHDGVLCDGCGGEVRGIRFKCGACPDYDLCFKCKANGLHDIHPMFEIHGPSTSQGPQLPAVQCNQQSAFQQQNEYLHDGVLCDGCGGEVRGIRFKCGACPDYDLCFKCKANGLHDIHPMFEIHGPSTSQGPQLPAVQCNQQSAFQQQNHYERVFVWEAPGNSNQQLNGFTDPVTVKWSPVQSGTPFRRHPLTNFDEEYAEVVRNISSSGGGRWIDKVVAIERIENYRLYSIYRSCKEDMDREHGPGFQNERILWHGTSSTVLGNIFRGGFNRSYCGKNATAFGDGVYFATSFEYSASSTYSPPDCNGHKYIFQCLVLTGYFTPGQKGIKEPPMRTHEMRYDSVVDSAVTPKMFVVFKDMQVYPQYVIALRL